MNAYENTGLITNNGTLTVANVNFGYSGTDVAQQSGTFAATDVTAQYSNVFLHATGGDSRLSEMDLHMSGSGAVSAQVDGGSVALTDLDVSAPVQQTAGVLNTDNAFIYGAPRSLVVSGGSAHLSSSAVSVDPTSVTGSGVLTADRASFTSPVTVDGSGAAATFVASSFAVDDGTAITSTNGATVRLAGTAISDSEAPACNGSVVDGGYNSAYDTSCDFTADTSTGSAPRCQLHSYGQDGVSVGGAPISVLAPFSGPGYDFGQTPAPNTLVDRIPTGATASFDPSIALCAVGSTDARGQVRPVAGRCDIGAVELSPTTLTLTASPNPTVQGRTVTLRATLTQPAGTPGGVASGTIDILGPTQADTSACGELKVDSSASVTCTVKPYGVDSTYTATFTSDAGQHAATASIVAHVTPSPVTITITAPKTLRAGSRGTATAYVVEDSTRRPGQYAVALQLDVRSAGGSWHAVGPIVYAAAGTGRAHETITPTRTAQYRWRSRPVTDLDLAGTSASATVSVVR